MQKSMKDNRAKQSDPAFHLTAMMQPMHIGESFSCSPSIFSYDTSICLDSQQPKYVILRKFYPGKVDVFHKICGLHGDLLTEKCIPDVFATQHPDGNAYILYEANCRDRLLEDRMLRYAVKKRLDIVYQIAKKVAFLHQRDISLGNLKFKNILYTEGAEIQFWNLDCAVRMDPAADKQTQHYKWADISALGHMLYQSIVGEALTMADLKDKDFLHGVLAQKVTGKMYLQATNAEIASLLHIFRRSLRKSEADHYISMEEMACDLDALLKAVTRKRRPVSENLNAHWAAADFLNQNPLWPYVRVDDAGKRWLNVVLVGSAPIGNALFENIFATAQMLDTQLRIHVLAENMETFELEYFEDYAPLLRYTTTVIRKGYTSLYDTQEKLDADIVAKNPPFAELIFEECADLPTAQMLLEEKPGCVLLLNKFTKRVRELADALITGSQEPLLVGVGAKRKLDQSGIGQNRNVDLRVLPLDGAYLDDDKLKKTPIYQKALKIHTYYSKEQNERASRKEILETFRDPGNVKSSLRSALALPYKAFSCGLENAQNLAEEFYQRILSPQADKAQLRRLIWLEHRSYQAYLIINGWTLLPFDQLEEHLFSENNPSHSHQDKGKKRHACLYASRDDGIASALERGSRDVWDRPDDTGLDLLDQLSVKLHCFYKNHADAKTIDEMRKALSECLSTEKALELEGVVARLLAEDMHSDIAWKKLLPQLEDAVKDSEAAANQLKDLQKQIRVVLLRNEYRDFKTSDQAVIDAVPYLLLDDAIGCIYKLCADHSWENIATSIFIEPAKLILLTDGDNSLEEKELTNFRAFLMNRRMLSVTVAAKDLREVQTVEPSAVLDVTGATANQILAVLQHPVLSKLPIIEYRNGKLINPGQIYCPVHFYPRNRSLTVEETLAVTGSGFLPQNDNNLLSAANISAKFWRAVQEMNGTQRFVYNRFVSLLVENTFADVVEFKGTMEPYYLEQDYANRKSIKNLLTQMSNQELIHINIQKNWSRKIVANKRTNQQFINKVLKAAVKQCAGNTMDEARYELRDIGTQGKPQFLVRDTGLQCMFSVPFDNKYESVEAGNGRLTLKEINSVFQRLKELGAVCPCGSKPFCTVVTHKAEENYKKKEYTELLVQFRFTDDKYRELLTKEGNILEAFSYHAIRQANMFDDVQLGVNILWEDMAGCKCDTKNEIDLVCTKGVKSYFISCKKRGKIEQEHLTEIRYQADRFGVDGTAIMVTTAQPDNNDVAYSRAKRMGVKIITLCDFQTTQTHAEDSAAVLVRSLKSLLT